MFAFQYEHILTTLTEVYFPRKRLLLGDVIDITLIHGLNLARVLLNPQLPCSTQVPPLTCLVFFILCQYYYIIRKH